MLAKAAPRVFTAGVASSAAQEAAEDAAGIDIPEITPNSILGATGYREGKKLVSAAHGGLANYFNDKR